MIGCGAGTRAILDVLVVGKGGCPLPGWRVLFAITRSLEVPGPGLRVVARVPKPRTIVSNGTGRRDGVKHLPASAQVSAVDEHSAVAGSHLDADQVAVRPGWCRIARFDEALRYPQQAVRVPGETYSANWEQCCWLSCSAAEEGRGDASVLESRGKVRVRGRYRCRWRSRAR
jgi:hypothetical protein